MKDQASSLRNLVKGNQRKLDQIDKNGKNCMIVVTSGKGGVGKSFLALNLAYAFSSLKSTVLLIDANLHNPGLHILTNTDLSYPLHYWLTESLPVENKALLSLNDKLDFLGNSISSQKKKQYLQINAHLFMELIMPLTSNYDYIIFDLQTGLSQWNLALLMQADVCFMLTISDPTSIIDTYTMIKATTEFLPASNYRLTVNQVLRHEIGKEAHQNLNLALKHFLNLEIELAALIPFETQVRDSFKQQKPLWEIHQNSNARKTILNLAKNIHFQNKEDIVLENKNYEEVII
jgi:flagellar biosynthesis protein FlhG